MMGKSQWANGVGVALLVLELLVFALPVTLLDGFGLLMLSRPTGHPDYAPMLVGVLLASIALVGFWRLAFGFLLDGLTLHGAPRWARWCTGTGAVLCLGALLIAGLFNRLNALAFVGVLGLPVMVPLGHMLVVSQRVPTPPPLP
ncbi:hypothetical protein [Stenotrophomonas rhizophila]|uniref:hypothetical protein n=1 Tax=Stenotrophomonas rhizophila TaxID=216778 RepID=UPI0028ACC48A|nr:hypothetical protein [Stenotrophomonas rhizophila]